MVAHVELFGLPGSGKTTVRDRVCKKRHSRSLPAPDAYKIALCKLIYSGRSWSLCQYIPQSLLQRLRFLQTHIIAENVTERYQEFHSVATNIIMSCTEEKDRQSTAIVWLKKLIKEYDAISRTLFSSNIVVFDEGFLQRSLSFFCPPHPSTSLSETQIKNYVDTMPTPDLVVVLDISTDVSCERMASRESGIPSSYTHLSQKQLQESLNRMESYIEHIKTVVEDTNIPLICVKNEESLDRTLQQIHQALPHQTSDERGPNH